MFVGEKFSFTHKRNFMRKWVGKAQRWCEWTNCVIILKEKGIKVQRTSRPRLLLSIKALACTKLEFSLHRKIQFLY